MVEEKKLLLVKVETLNNTIYALTKFVSFEEFSWSREIMGVVGLDKRQISLVPPLERKQQVVE